MFSPHVTVINYRKGNLTNVARMLRAAGASAEISSGSDQARAIHQIKNADALVLPGVGSFADAMGFLDSFDLSTLLRQRITEGLPFLGICLGLQLLFESGEEGGVGGTSPQGLGVLPGHAALLAKQDRSGHSYKVPHVGWNQVCYTGLADGSSASSGAATAHLFKGIPDQSNFYFTHSYVVCPDDRALVVGETDYSCHFVSAVAKDTLFGVQFHPEKSARLGAQLLNNFVEIVRTEMRK
ncbi:MAG: imidazole glycerol phosphate synthase subunit HisH [Coriobacteriales bacterium]|jgi:glutamine amidotransferase|nr:imidazole glycerol phosphate synthase subunit HisH [Coriobacteriales bacterium]